MTHYFSFTGTLNHLEKKIRNTSNLCEVHAIMRLMTDVSCQLIGTKEALTLIKSKLLTTATSTQDELNHKLSDTLGWSEAWKELEQAVQKMQTMELLLTEKRCELEGHQKQKEVDS